MNTDWSTYIQKIETLNRHRSLRFNDYTKKLFMDAFNIEGSPKILELGCGSGILSDMLNKWYPGSSITGIDRDTGFINYCRRRYSQNKNLEFIEADTESLPFKNESFDIVISHTVAEHIDPAKFYPEQYKVLKITTETRREKIDII